MGVPTKRLGDGDAGQLLYGVTSRKLSNALRTGLHVYQRFDGQPSLSAPNGYGDPTGTTNDKNRATWRHGLSAQYNVKGTQTLLGPLLDVDKGLDISQDQTDNDGVEYVFGALGLYGVHTVVVPDYIYGKLTFRIADVSGTDDCNFGLRKNEAFQANVDDYDEAAWLNINLGTVVQETILNNAATTSTVGTPTWADDATHSVTFKLVGRQVVFYFDDLPLAGMPAYQFDVGEVVLPFFFFLQATTTPGKVWWKSLEIGRTSETTSNGLNGI